MNDPRSRILPLLRQGERLLWVGQPDARVRFTGADSLLMPFSIFRLGLGQNVAFIDVPDADGLLTALDQIQAGRGAADPSSWGMRRAPRSIKPARTWHDW
jgi:hypothetical protein